MSNKSNIEIPLYTTGSLNIPSTTFIPNANTTYISAYTGNTLDSRPTFGTKTDNTTNNTYYHGGIYIGNNQVICHFLK